MEIGNALPNSSYASDFERFRQNYPQSLLVKQCELKIDSLDWETAKKLNTPEALADYMEKHPDGRYAQDASQVQNTLEKSIVTPEERSQISSAFHGFFQAFGENDNASLFTYITPTMNAVPFQKERHEADVGDIINRTYSSDIENCSFVVNDDYQVKKDVDEQGNTTYTVSSLLTSTLNARAKGNLWFLHGERDPQRGNENFFAHHERNFTLLSHKFSTIPPKRT